MILTHKSKRKFELKWEGSYVIDKVYSNGAYALLNMEGDRCIMHINDKFLKKVLYLNIILLLIHFHTMLFPKAF